MDQESDTPSRQFRWNRLVTGWLVALFSVAIFQIAGWFLWPPEVRGWIALGTTLPIATPLFVAVLVVGAQASSDPWIRRDSVLWRWFSGVGAAFSALLGLGVGALLGAVVGAAVATSRTVGDLIPSVQIVIALIGAGGLVAIAWWSSVVAIDMYRLGPKKRARAARRSLGNTDRARRAATIASEFSSPVEVVLCGLLILMLIAQLWAWVIASLGAGA